MVMFFTLIVSVISQMNTVEKINKKGRKVFKNAKGKSFSFCFFLSTVGISMLLFI